MRVEVDVKVEAEVDVRVPYIHRSRCEGEKIVTLMVGNDIGALYR